MSKIIGITGLIAAGKSTLTNYLKESGYTVFDADLEVKKLYKENDFLIKLKNDFPVVFTNEALNKKILWNIIFTNNTEKTRLERLIHPAVEIKCDDFIEINKKQKLIFLDIPLLFEVNWNKKCNKIILVMVDKEIQRERYSKRGGEMKLFDRITESLYSIEYKKSKSDYIIENNGTIEEFYRKIDKILINEI